GELLELLADRLDVVVGVRPAGVARELRHLPGREVLEDVGGLDAQLVAQLADLVADVQGIALAGMRQLLDLGVQFGDRLLEIEEVGVHPGQDRPQSPRLYPDGRDTRLYPAAGRAMAGATLRTPGSSLSARSRSVVTRTRQSSPSSRSAQPCALR